MKHLDINEINRVNINKVIDIREPYEYEHEHIKGVINIPMMDLAHNYEMYLNKEDTYYLMCRTATRTRQLCTYLEPLGYKVVNLEYGISGYNGETTL